MIQDKLIATPSRTTEIMKQYDIKMKKSLGQNFLVEPQILDRMVQTAKITDQTTVIEIGPGIGALTEVLARTARQVIAFEIDQRFITILADTLAAYNNVQIIHQDILDVDLSSPDLQQIQEAEDLVVVANLPYYITTPIIMKLISSALPFRQLVMMMQKEVAQKMTASVGDKDYNSLSIAIQNSMQADLAFIVPKTVFIPQPRVDSAVLSLTRRDHPLVEVADDHAFQSFVRSCFAQRRKTLWNNLKKIDFPEERSLDSLELALGQLQIEPSRRAQTLTIEEFAALYRCLFESGTVD
ncbi:16S rRNA (adenine(1518)-N(6)/adenine(1519)-N(6))-dimethyltransferase RsmA [Hutsoniella sourekii]